MYDFCTDLQLSVSVLSVPLIWNLGAPIPSPFADQGQICRKQTQTTQGHRKLCRPTVKNDGISKIMQDTDRLLQNSNSSLGGVWPVSNSVISNDLRDLQEHFMFCEPFRYNFL